jgi:adenine-specific DNA-methyltransferase
MSIEKIKPSFHFEAERIEQLKQIAPEAFADGKIIWENLQEALGDFVDDENANSEHFGLFWPGKREARKIASTSSLGTLIPCAGEGLDEVNTKNVFIEGDNLEVLKLLQKSYSNRIKLIYIDPPYNTGSDFIYDDNFTENIDEYMRRTGQLDEDAQPISTNTKADGRFHSKWLSMMYPRLRLARNLLSNDGFIFISIDENEICNLKLLMNEVFGEENFISCIANVNNPKGRSDDKYIATAHEYLLVYKKDNGDLLGFDPEEKVTKRYNKTEDNALYREIDLRKTGDNDRREDRPNLFYYFYYSEDKSEFFPSKTKLDLPTHIEITPTRKDGSDGNWRWGFDTVVLNIEKLAPNFMGVRKKWTVVEKDFLTEDKTVKPTTAWTFKEVNSERGSEQFIELGFDKELFPKPKPLGLLSKILKISINKYEDNFVLDFFAGSGSFANAVIEFNKENNCDIKHISVQLPYKIQENEYAYKKGYRVISEITKERLIKASNKYKPKDFGFKVFKFYYSNYKPWKNYTGTDVKELEKLFEKNTSPLVEDWKPENLLSEILIIEGFPLHSSKNILTRYSDNKIIEVISDFCEHKLIICLDDKIDDNTIKTLELSDNDIFICLDNAISDKDKVTLQDKGLIKTI